MADSSLDLSIILLENAKPMVELLVNRVAEEIRLVQGFREELNNLQKKIQIIAGIVGSLNVAVSSDAAVGVGLWLRRTLRIIYNAEDMLDELAYENHRKVALQRSKTGKMKLAFSPIRDFHVSHFMAPWIQTINSNIENVLKEAQTIVQLKAVVQSASSQQQPPAANNNISDQVLEQVRRHVDTSLIIGRDSDVHSVVDMLCNPSRSSDDNNSSNRLSVVAIVGLGGMGKTSLAEQVYENKRVISHFSERIWISELKDFTIERILNTMLEFLGMGNYENACSEIAIRKLEKYLGGKRYLLVLDDVWSTNQDLWHSIRNKLERIGGSKESMILTTTRSDAVVETMRASSVHRLSGLSEVDSWSLFKQYAFANRLNGDAFTFEARGRKIVEKCKGVPLAIRSIAGIQHSKRNLHEWTIIEQSELWDIPHYETGILPSLKLSYDHLPSPILKKCFTLCGIWPKRTLFAKFELIDRWIALGLIQQPKDRNLTMEDIAEDYINVLLNISFLLVEEMNELGEVMRYGLHDLVYDLARSLATHEHLYLEADNKVENDLDDVRHLTVVGLADISLDVKDKLVLENLRSLEIFRRYPRGLLMHIKYLRVLCLKRLGIVVVPESIGRLKCLKYLDMASNPIKVLPECIMEIYSLQSLILYHCSPLSELPKGRLSNLVNLRHLGLSFYLRAAQGMIRQLTELQTLPPLQLIEGGFQIAELGCLHHIRGNLEIKGLELIKRKIDLGESDLSKKPRVEQLRLSWDNDKNCINHEEVLGGLYPNPNLKLLSIKGYAGDKFPSWVMRMNVLEECNNGYAGTLCNLIKIELIDCIRCQHLPTLGHLPFLKMIEIRNMENLKQIGLEFYGVADLLLGNTNEASSSGSSRREKSMMNFASLKELRLSGLSNLEEWCEPGAGTWLGFPSLEVLVIEKCRRLRKAPNKFPILKELIVREMSSSYPLIKIMSNKSSVSYLTKLEIDQVEELTHIPEEVGECTSLQTLIIYYCYNLVWIPNLSGLGSLRELNLVRNYGLRGAPEGLESFKSLDHLGINCCGKVETLPELAGLSRLRVLGMSKMIRQPPNWLYNLPSIRVLYIGNYDYEGLNEFPDFSCLLKITSLEALYVFGWKELQSLPEQLQHFTALKTLGILDFENVEHLPDWLGNLSSLQTLCSRWCKRLKKLPSKEAMERLPNFSYLEIRDCPLLEQAVNRNGPEYHKIAGPRIKVKIINSTS